MKPRSRSLLHVRLCLAKVASQAFSQLKLVQSTAEPRTWQGHRSTFAYVRKTVCQFEAALTMDVPTSQQSVDPLHHQ